MNCSIRSVAVAGALGRDGDGFRRVGCPVVSGCPVVGCLGGGPPVGGRRRHGLLTALDAVAYRERGPPWFVHGRARAVVRFRRRRLVGRVRGPGDGHGGPSATDRECSAPQPVRRLIGRVVRRGLGVLGVRLLGVTSRCPVRRGRRGSLRGVGFVVRRRCGRRASGVGVRRRRSRVGGRMLGGRAVARPTPPPHPRSGQQRRYPAQPPARVPDRSSTCTSVYGTGKAARGFPDAVYCPQRQSWARWHW